MSRWLLRLTLLTALIPALAWVGHRILWHVEEPIRIGILHSGTGPLAISEQSMIDAELMAIDEINKEGGLLGRKVKAVVADGRSDPRVFAQEARRLIDQERVTVIFGCWASATRKSVKPIVEQADHLLVYPNAYEGLEQSPMIFYTGAAPNQQVIPAVNWCREALKARRFYLVGSDYIWPHCVNAIVKDQLKAFGAEVAGEYYIGFGSTGSDVGDAIRAIKSAGPDVIISTVAGDTNAPFYQGLMTAGIGPERVPVIAFGIAEDELRSLPLKDMVGDYAAWNYLQSIDRPENREFIRRFQARYGTDRVTSDVIVASYNSVHLWAQAVKEGLSDRTAEVRKFLLHQSLNAPEGIISIDQETQHTWRPVYLGRIRADGQFDIVWKLDKPVRPVPYPAWRTRREWDQYVEALYTSWGENWFNPRKGPGPSAKTRSSTSPVRSRNVTDPA